MVRVHGGVVTDELKSDSQGLNREVQARRRNSDFITDIVTKNCEKSAEVIAPRSREGLNNSKSLIEMYVSNANQTKYKIEA